MSTLWRGKFVLGQQVRSKLTGERGTIEGWWSGFGFTDDINRYTFKGTYSMHKETDLEEVTERIVGDTASDARGSGARFNSGKPALDMIPLHLLEGAARVFHGVTTREVKPYPKWNWAKGMPWSVPLGCIKRHIGAWERGEDKDPETGESHLDHIICNLLMLKHYEDAFIEGDDRPKQFFKKGGVNAKA